MATRKTTAQRDRLIEAAQNAYTFTVEGRGDFPFDMLRYDLCWPASEADARLIGSWVIDRGVQRTITLHGLKDPTVRRWQSFGWTVTAVTP